MTFQATLSGHVDTDTTEAGNAAAREVEQRIFDSIAQIVEEANTEGLVVHAVQFSGQFVQDTILPGSADPSAVVDSPGVGDTQAAVAEGLLPAPDSTDGGVNAPPAPTVFVARLADEDYSTYLERVAAWNADPANADAQITPGDEGTWSALTPDGAATA